MTQRDGPSERQLLTGDGVWRPSPDRPGRTDWPQLSPDWPGQWPGPGQTDDGHCGGHCVTAQPQTQAVGELTQPRPGPARCGPRRTLWRPNDPADSDPTQALWLKLCGQLDPMTQTQAQWWTNPGQLLLVKDYWTIGSIIIIVEARRTMTSWQWPRWPDIIVTQWRRPIVIEQPSGRTGNDPDPVTDPDWWTAQWPRRAQWPDGPRRTHWWRPSEPRPRPSEGPGRTEPRQPSGQPANPAQWQQLDPAQRTDQPVDGRQPGPSGVTPDQPIVTVEQWRPRRTDGDPGQTKPRRWADPDPLIDPARTQTQPRRTVVIDPVEPDGPVVEPSPDEAQAPDGQLIIDRQLMTVTQLTRTLVVSPAQPRPMTVGQTMTRRKDGPVDQPDPVRMTQANLIGQWQLSQWTANWSWWQTSIIDDPVGQTDNDRAQNPVTQPRPRTRQTSESGQLWQTVTQTAQPSQTQ